MIKLSININKVATLRNSRGGNIPDVVKAAIDCERFGANGITVHPRPDQRHIRYEDVRNIAPIIRTEFNIEGYPSKSFIDLVLEVRPTQVTLVPDPPEALTSNAGWDTKKFSDFLKEIVLEFKSAGIRTSLFLDPNPDMIESAFQTGTDRIELYTEMYATDYQAHREQAIKPYKATAKKAAEMGLGINAGHDLNLINLSFFAKQIPSLQEVSIGHALIADALYLGLENTIQAYKRQLLA